MKIFSPLGTNKQTISGMRKAPADMIEMLYERPTLNHISQSDGTWIERPDTPEEFKAKKLDELRIKGEEGVKTSVRDLVVQCGKDDVEMLMQALMQLDLSPEITESIIRPLDNSIQPVTVDEFKQICKEVSEARRDHLMEYWTSIDEFQNGVN